MVQQHFQEWEFQGRCFVIIGPVNLPISVEGEEVTFRWYCFHPIKADEVISLESLVSLSKAQQGASSVLTYGDFEQAVAPPIRIHSVCQTGDVFGSLRCDCGPQLKGSLAQIVQEGTGALLYLANQEGRGIGLLSKAMTYLLQQQGLDTFQANRSIGCQDDERTYEEAGAILHFLRDGRAVSLLTNNPKKIESLETCGIRVENRRDVTIPAQKHNRHYMMSKIKSGHLTETKFLGIEEQVVSQQRGV